MQEAEGRLLLQPAFSLFGSSYRMFFLTVTEIWSLGTEFQTAVARLLASPKSMNA